MKTGVFTLPRADLDNLGAVYWAKENGIAAYEPLNFGDLEAADPENARKIYAASQETGVVLPCLSVGINLFADISNGVELLKAFARAASIMHIPYLHHTLYTPYTRHLLSEENGVEDEEVMKVCIPAAREVWDYANSLGVECIYEDQGDCFNGIENMDRFLRLLDRPARLVMDVGNCLFIGEQPDDIARYFAGRFAHAHIKDYQLLEDGSQSLYPLANGKGLSLAMLGEGALRIRETLALLKEQDYSGWYMLECSPIQDPEEEIRQNGKWLKDALDSLYSGS